MGFNDFSQLKGKKVSIGGYYVPTNLKDFNIVPPVNLQDKLTKQDKSEETIKEQKESSILVSVSVSSLS